MQLGYKSNNAMKRQNTRNDNRKVIIFS